MLRFLLSYLHWLDSCGGLCLALYYGQSDGCEMSIVVAKGACGGGENC